MSYYVFVIDNEINGKGECPCQAENLICIEVEKQVYDNLDHYIYKNGKIVLDPNYDKKQLAKAKKDKYQEALYKANDYINSSALYRFNAENTIEATDGNIAKFTAYTVGFSAGALETVYWTTHEDNLIELNAQDVQTILTGLGEIQSEIWNVQFIAYKNAIQNASTVEEVESIEVVYGI